MNKIPLFACLIGLMAQFALFSVPKKGTPAPDVTFTDTHGKNIKVSDFAGKKLALVFLPSTSGWSVNCKAQACSIKAGLEDLVDYGISLLCISADSNDKLIKFSQKNDLHFPLLHANANVIKAYDLNALVGIQRYTFLIDEKGIIVKVITKVDVDNHAQQIIDDFNAAQ
jgi:peroxiredoxin Q/BCP